MCDTTCNATYETCISSCYYLYDVSLVIAECEMDCYFDRESCDDWLNYTPA